MIDAKVALLALAAGGTGILGFGAYQVQAHGGFRGHGRHQMLEKFADFVISEKLDKVGASEAQKQKVQAIKGRLMQEGHALRADREAVCDKLIALLEQDKPDAGEVKALAHERIEAFTKLADDAADALVELHGVFTPEQRRQLLADVRAHIEEHHRR